MPCLAARPFVRKGGGNAPAIAWTIRRWRGVCLPLGIAYIPKLELSAVNRATSHDMSTLARAFAPGAVGNVAVGFDLMGHAIAGVGDIAHVRRTEEQVVRIEAIHGDVPGVGEIPLDALLNTAGVALASMRVALALPFGFELTLYKGIALGSGLGGSAASCVAALVAANGLLDAPLSMHALYPFALAGESVSSGSRQGDNVAPMLFGGLVLATATRVVQLDVPEWLHAVVVHPVQTLETRRARESLRAPYQLATFVQQASNLALVLTGLQRGDGELIRGGLRDVLVEPRRAGLIPGFAQVQAAALDHDALGASISGAGPSVFAWFESSADAARAAPAMQQAFADAGFNATTYVGPVAAPGAHRLTEAH